MLKTLAITHFRNIQTAKLDFHDRFNLIYGENGCGKTSLLEAIYSLGQGKSFRTTSPKNLIQTNEESLILFGNIHNGEQHLQIGMEKTLQTTYIKMNGEKQKSTLQLLKEVPIVLVNPDSYDLVEAGPDVRRAFLNWGMFHVEHSFHNVWKNFNRCLKQRNAALKQQQSSKVWQSWDVELAEYGEALTVLRQTYLAELLPIFKKLMTQLPFPHEVEIKLDMGWNQGIPLLEALKQSSQKDTYQGHTTVGPHRADIILSIKNGLAEDRLSRGQEKLLVSVLRLSQGLLLLEKNQQTCIYLLDDLASELDPVRKKALLALCETVPGQFFITATDRAVFDENPIKDSKMFHVEHGVILEN
jgi:DNA replication and repair protein RecF